MEQNERSVAVTVVLSTALVVGNWWFWQDIHRGLDFPLYWPVPFILCVVIAARIWRGHNSL